MPKLPAHQVTTRNLGAAYLFVAEAGLGQRGVVIGDDLLGGSFVFDPFELHAAGVVSTPNMVRGNSTWCTDKPWPVTSGSIDLPTARAVAQLSGRTQMGTQRRADLVSQGYGHDPALH